MPVGFLSQWLDANRATPRPMKPGAGVSPAAFWLLCRRGQSNPRRSAEHPEKALIRRLDAYRIPPSPIRQRIPKPLVLAHFTRPQAGAYEANRRAAAALGPSVGYFLCAQKVPAGSGRVAPHEGRVRAGQARKTSGRAAPKSPLRPETAKSRPAAAHGKIGIRRLYIWISHKHPARNL